VNVLREYLREHRDELCDEHRDRFEVNPLRVLDCKRPECLTATENAPRMVDYLEESCAKHFARVREGLEAVGVAYRLEPRLVRGLDYYTRTTFEFASLALQGAQNAIGGGGRYDGLAEAIGGPPTPGIGFGIGIERLLLSCDAEDCFGAAPARPDVFVVDVTGGAIARDIVSELRALGLEALRAYDDRSMKAQMKLADRSGARFAVVVGEKELETSTVTLQDLRRSRDDGSGGEEVARDELGLKVLAAKVDEESVDR
jgi:histidyl-tRNA synthetase